MLQGIANPLQSIEKKKKKKMIKVRFYPKRLADTCVYPMFKKI